MPNGPLRQEDFSRRNYTLRSASTVLAGFCLGADDFAANFYAYSVLCRTDLFRLVCDRLQVTIRPTFIVIDRRYTGGRSSCRREETRTIATSRDAPQRRANSNTTIDAFSHHLSFQPDHWAPSATPRLYPRPRIRRR